MSMELMGGDKKMKEIKEKIKSNWRTMLCSGMVGAAFVVLIVVFVGLLYPGYRISNYYINEDPSALTELLSVDLSPADSTTVAKAIQEESVKRKDLLEDLLKQNIIVSSDVFASNLSGYYNTLIAVLSAILIIINLVGFFSWRSNANVSLEQKQRELDDTINGVGALLEDKIEEVLRKNQVVKDKIEAYIQEVVDQENHLTDDEWDKIHLLLDKYKKKEVLIDIEEDEKDNNGEIEE